MPDSMLDLSRIEELRADFGSDDLTEVLMVFCAEIDDALNTLADAPLETRLSQLHFIKGSAMNVGLEVLGHLCSAEEIRLAAASPGTPPDVDTIRQAYDTGVRALLNAVRSTP